MYPVLVPSWDPPSASTLTLVYPPQCFVNSIATCLAGAWKDESGEAGQRVQVHPSSFH